MASKKSIPIPKIKALLLYFATHTDTKYLGKVKLMKLFYFADFMHLKKYGVPITNDTYINLEHGPIPSVIKNLVDSAADDIEHSVLQDTIYFERPDNTAMYRVLPIRNFTEEDTKYLSEHELDILNKVCLRFGEKTTRYIEQESHEESRWKVTKLLDTIPYELAALDKDSNFTREELDLMSQI